MKQRTTGVQTTSTLVGNGVWTTISATPTRLVGVDTTPIYNRRFTSEEFLAIEDKDLQKYVFKQGIDSVDRRKIIDNDEKYGVYCTTISVRQNNRGTFYRHSKLEEYIVYNKKTKKISFSNMRLRVFNHLVKEKFGTIDGLVTGLFTNPTKTLCKKIIEGKIESIGDLVQYHISYTMRDKRLTTYTARKFLSCSQPGLCHIFEDANSIAMEDNFYDIIDDLPVSFSQTRPFLIKKEDLPNINVMYDKWWRTQDSKYAALFRNRDGSNGSIDVSDSAY